MRKHFGKMGAIIATGLLVIATGCTTDSADNAGGSAEAANDDETVSLRFASLVPEDGFIGQGLQEWADAVEEASDGSLDITIYGNGSLLPGTEILEGVADGRAEMGITSSNYHPAEMPLWNVVAIPYVSENGFATTQALNELYLDNEDFSAEFERLGVHALGFYPVGNNT